MRHICAIYDNKAQDLIGNIMCVRHPAAAIRSFSDVAGAQEPNMVAQHPEDFDLVELALIPDDDEPTTLIPSYQILITGAQWKAAQQANLNTSGE